MREPLWANRDLYAMGAAPQRLAQAALLMSPEPTQSRRQRGGVRRRLRLAELTAQKLAQTRRTATMRAASSTAASVCVNERK